MRRQVLGWKSLVLKVRHSNQDALHFKFIDAKGAFLNQKSPQVMRMTRSVLVSTLLNANGILIPHLHDQFGKVNRTEKKSKVIR